MDSNILKSFFCIFLFLSLSPFSKAQDLPGQKIEWGKSIKNSNKAVLSKIITQDASGFYTIKVKQGNQAAADGPQKVYIEHYNRAMDLTKSTEVDLKWKKKKRQFEDVLKIGGELYLFTSFNNQVKKKNFLFAQKLNKSRLQADKELQFVADIDTKNKFKEGSFNFHISRDSSKVLIYNQLPYEKNKPERFALRVFNNDLTLIWKKNIVLPYDDSQFSIEDYQVDNNGNVYLLGELYGDASGFRMRGQANYQYVILAYTNAGTEANKYPIKISDKFLTDLTFRPANDGQLVCCGFYSEKGTYSVKGTYFFKIDPLTKKLSNENFKPLDFSFRTEYISDRKKSKYKRAERSGNNDKAPELYQFALDDLILRADGGALLIAEQFYIEKRVRYDPYYGSFGSYNTGRREEYDYIYHYNDIIVVNINPDGEIAWASRIPKRQETENDGGWYSSYAMSIVRDKIYFVYNDNAKNYDANAKERRQPYAFHGNYALIAVSQVNSDGSVDSYPLLQNKNSALLTRPFVCKQIGPKDMAIFGGNNRLYRFGKLSF